MSNNYFPELIEEAYVWHKEYWYEFLMEVWGVEDDYDAFPASDTGFKTHETGTESEMVSFVDLPAELQDELEKNAICRHESPECYDDDWEY